MKKLTGLILLILTSLTLAFVLSCKPIDETSNKPKDSHDIQAIKKAYPYCRVYPYKDENAEYTGTRYLIITEDSVICVLDLTSGSTPPFKQTIFITKI